MKKQIFKTPFQLLFSLLVALMLVACGGSGGSGSGAPPQKLTITADNVTIAGVLTEESLINITFTESTIDGFNAQLVDVDDVSVDVTSLFVDAPSNSDGKKVKKLNVYALQGLISERSKLTASVAGSQIERFDLDYQGKPELLFTTVEGEGINGFDGTGLEIKNKAGAFYGIQEVNEEWPIRENRPLKDSNLALVKGEVRNALLKELLHNSNPIGVISESRKEFELNNRLTFSENSTRKGADYLLVATSAKGRENTTRIAIPGKEIEDIFALQLNDLNKEHVISEWVNDAIVAYFETITDTDPEIVPLSNDIPGGDSRCEGLFKLADPSGESSIQALRPYKCKLEIFEVKMAGDNSRGFDTTVNFLPQKESDGRNTLDQGWSMKAQLVSNKPVIVGMHVILQPESNVPPKMALLTVEIERPSITVDIGVGKFADELIALNVHNQRGPETYPNSRFKNTTESLTVTYDSIKSAGIVICNTESDCFGKAIKAEDYIAGLKDDIEDSLKLYAGDKAYCLQPLTINSGSDHFNPNDYYQCGYVKDGKVVVNKPWEKIGDKTELAIFADPNVDDIDKKLVSIVEQELTASRFAKDADIPVSMPGFMSFAGYQKTHDKGVHLNAIGTHFVTNNSTSKVAQGNINIASAQADAIVSVSSNSLNQALLSAYQSKQLQIQNPTTIEALGLSNFKSGDYGANFYAKNKNKEINEAGESINKDIAVDMVVSFETPPYVRFIDGYVEVVARNLKVVMSMPATAAECSFGTTLFDCTVGAPEKSIVMDVKARAIPSLNGSQFLEFSADDIMLHILSSDAQVTVKSTNTLPIVGKF